MTGQTISHYRILEKLGEGGMGVVYKAEDLKLRRIVALKFLPRHAIENRERFLREAQAAASLNHPNICTIHEIDEAHGFIAMEFIEGRSVKEKIEVRPLPLEEALDIAIQACTGLQAAHEKGVVHRDIKPANLMLTAQGQIKIMDFGLAQVGERTRITKSGFSMGTPAYMSPEQAQGKPTDRRTDIWSLVVVLYEMVTGRLPFRGDTEHAVSFGIVHSEPEPLTALRSNVPTELDRIVAKALEKDPGERYQHVEDLNADLRRLTRSRDSSVAIPARGGSRRRRLLLIAGLSLLVLAAAAVIWRTRIEKPESNPLADARYTRLTDFEGSEQDAAISPDGKLLAFLSDQDGAFDAWIGQIGGGSFVNVSKGEYQRLLNEELRNLGFTADSAQMWLRTHDRTPGPNGMPARVAVAPILGGGFRPFLEGCVTAAWSPDGSRVVYHDAVPGDPMYITDRTGGDRRRIFIQTQEGVHSHYPTWSPDQRYIYFSAGFPPDEMDVWRIPSTGGSPERITSHNSRVAYPTLLDDRTLLYSATAEDGSGRSLYAMDLERRVPRRVSSGVEQYSSVSADAGYGNRSRRIVATLSDPSGSLASVPITGSVVEEASVRKVIAATPKAAGPRWGPDYLLHLASRGPSDSLWLWKDGKGRELWRSVDGGLTAPASPSPDGKLICFSYRSRDKASLYLMNADGTNVRLLTDTFRVRSPASWSPDGKWVAVSGDEGAGGRVFKVPIDGGPPVRLINTLSFNPVWSPDNKLILYTAGRVATYHTVKAVTPDGQPVALPNLQVPVSVDGYRFLPGGKQAVVLQGYFRDQNFWLFDFPTGKLVQLTKLISQNSAIRRFDISPDGKNIFFDRITDNSDVVLIETRAR